jgi:hypothetical protein
MLDLTPTAPAACYEAPPRWIECFERCLRRVCVPETLHSLVLARGAVGPAIVLPGGCDDS